jgi:hypothetical protein
VTDADDDLLIDDYENNDYVYDDDVTIMMTTKMVGDD